MLEVKEKLLSRSTSPRTNGPVESSWLLTRTMPITMPWLLPTSASCSMDKWSPQRMHSICQWTAWSTWKWTNSGSMIFTTDGGMIWTSLLIIASTKNSSVVKLGTERSAINSQKTTLDQNPDMRWSSSLMDLYKKVSHISHWIGQSWEPRNLCLRMVMSITSIMIHSYWLLVACGQTSKPTIQQLEIKLPTLVWKALEFPSQTQCQEFEDQAHWQWQRNEIYITYLKL